MHFFFIIWKSENFFFLYFTAKVLKFWKFVVSVDLNSMVGTETAFENGSLKFYIWLIRTTLVHFDGQLYHKKSDQINDIIRV